jgi:carbamoyltransferase
MKIVGISYGHNASVCLVENGEITFIQSEERLNRLKNSTGFPVETLSFINENVCSLKNIDQVVIFQDSIYGYKFFERTKFKSVQYHDVLDPSRMSKRGMSTFRAFDFIWKIEDVVRRLNDRVQKTRVRENFVSYIRTQFGWDIPVSFIEHHSAHAYSVLPFIESEREWLILTLDAAGDFLSGTVSVYKNQSIQRISCVSHTHSLGVLYSTVTTLLGMKAGEHEYKVMGLAPYADKKYGEDLVKQLRNIVWMTRDGKIKLSNTPATLKKKLESIFKNQRFDNISYAVQTITEEIITQLIEYWIGITGVHNIALAGGVFMNVKANMKVLKLESVHRLIIVPSSGDESTAIGAAVAPLLFKRQKIKSIRHLYLGSVYSDEDVLAVLKNNEFQYQWYKDVEKSVALLLSQGEIVARFKGRMEFGARALGNRSILANPSRFESVGEINHAIKIRDFWMPFCPSILEEERDNYVQDYAKKVNLEYMAIAVECIPSRLKSVLAASHPRDGTIRPQIVSKYSNEDYHRLISYFKDLTGFGAVLNTSFNLHGEPNVCSPTDAIYTFKNSGLKYLAINNYLVVKN